MTVGATAPSYAQPSLVPSTGATPVEVQIPEDPCCLGFPPGHLDYPQGSKVVWLGKVEPVLSQTNQYSHASFAFSWSSSMTIRSRVTGAGYGLVALKACTYDPGSPTFSHLCCPWICLSRLVFSFPGPKQKKCNTVFLDTTIQVQVISISHNFFCFLCVCVLYQ